MRLATPSSRRKRRVGLTQAAPPNSPRAVLGGRHARLAITPAAASPIDSRRHVILLVAIAARSQINWPPRNAADARATLIGPQLE